MAVPGTAGVAGPLAGGGPFSCAPWIQTAAPALIVTGLVMTAPGSAQVMPGPAAGPQWVPVVVVVHADQVITDTVLP
jgi:hypothetical protein